MGVPECQMQKVFLPVRFLRLIALLSLKQEHGKLRVMFDTWVPENKRIQKGESLRSVNLDV